MKSRNKIPKTFIGFLLASILIWLLITLSKEYVTTISFPIIYSDISQNKMLLTTSDKELDFVVKSNGFKILKTRFNSKSITIKANSLIKKKSSTYYLLTKYQKQNIQKQLPSNLDLLEIIKDTLFLEVSSLVQKNFL